MDRDVTILKYGFNPNGNKSNIIYKWNTVCMRSRLCFAVYH